MRVCFVIFCACDLDLSGVFVWMFGLGWVWVDFYLRNCCIQCLDLLFLLGLLFGGSLLSVFWVCDCFGFLLWSACEVWV